MPRSLLNSLAALCFSVGFLHAQFVSIKPASLVTYPIPLVDSNSPGVWVNNTLHIYTSTVDVLSQASGVDLFSLHQTTSPFITPESHFPLWIESAWLDADGTVFAWYHHEPRNVCPNEELTAPQIGA